MTTEIDQLDRQILRELHADVRASYKSIGDKLSVSHNTIKARIDRMLARKVFSFAIITSPHKVGREATAYLLVSVKPSELEQVARTLSERREVAYLGFSIGEADMLALCHFNSNKELFVFVNGFVGNLSGVVEVRTILMCETVKTLSGDQSGTFALEATNETSGGPESAIEDIA